MINSPIENKKIKEWKCVNEYDKCCKYLEGYNCIRLCTCEHPDAIPDEYGDTYIIGMDKCPKKFEKESYENECIMRGMDNCSEDNCSITSGICTEDRCYINNLHQQIKKLNDKNKYYKEIIFLLIDDSCDKCGSDHCRIEDNSNCSIAQIYQEVIKYG